jgi:predicted glycoside hydrolase/deacetylase ChbG (UPF0249 family)
MPRQLIFNADDYGVSPGVSAGIRDAMAAGVVRSTTIMANLVSDAELNELKQLLTSSYYTLTAGCHLNLSCGVPLTSGYPADLLVEKDKLGYFNKLTALDRVTWRNRVLLPAVDSEWRAQLRYLLDRGLPITHLDSHHHVHLLPELFMLALALAQEHGLALRIRRNYRSVVRAERVPTPDSLIEGFYGSMNVSQDVLLSLLSPPDAPAGEITEVMCHPGRVDDVLRERSSYLTEREHELQTLSDPGLIDQLAALDCELTSYAAIAARGGAKSA